MAYKQPKFRSRRAKRRACYHRPTIAHDEVLAGIFAVVRGAVLVQHMDEDGGFHASSIVRYVSQTAGESHFYVGPRGSLKFGFTKAKARTVSFSRVAKYRERGRARLERYGYIATKGLDDGEI